MTVGIIYNESKTQSLSYVDLLKEAILRLSREETGREWSVLDQRDFSPADLVKDSDLLISVGGDGTFLKTASWAIRHDVPVYGFNLGTLGLLTEFEADCPEQSIRRLVRGDYVVEDRATLKVRVCDASGKVSFEADALNDCVLERDALSGVAYISLSVCDIFVDTYPCNGFVVATQTGSTAYSLSAGGPIVEPGNDVTVVTPICAHCTDGRPIVVRATSAVKLTLRRPHDSMFVSVDGHRNCSFGSNDILQCLPGDRNLKIIRIDPPNFYEALRRKAQERKRKLQYEV